MLRYSLALLVQVPTPRRMPTFWCFYCPWVYEGKGADLQTHIEQKHKKAKAVKGD